MISVASNSPSAETKELWTKIALGKPYSHDLRTILMSCTVFKIVVFKICLEGASIQEPAVPDHSKWPVTDQKIQTLTFLKVSLKMASAIYYHTHHSTVLLQVAELHPCDITFVVRAFFACFLFFLTFCVLLRFLGWSFVVVPRTNGRSFSVLLLVVPRTNGWSFLVALLCGASSWC